MGEMASAAKVFDTAISVTEARSRRASLQARAISRSTAARPCGEAADNCVVGLCVMFVSFSDGWWRWVEFYQIRERLFEALHSTLAHGQGTRMSGVTFNRNRVKLKKVLGIRARLALLALMLVAPLMLDRVRTLENFRSTQIAQAAAGYASLTAHAAETQREVVSSVETMLKSAAYIRASGGIAR